MISENVFNSIFTFCIYPRSSYLSFLSQSWLQWSFPNSRIMSFSILSVTSVYGLYLATYLCLYLYLYLSFFSISISISISIYISISLSILYLYLYLYLSLVYIYIYICIHIYLYIYIYLSISIYIYICVLILLFMGENTGMHSARDLFL